MKVLSQRLFLNLFSFLVGLCGCATLAPQSKELIEKKQIQLITKNRPFFQIETVPFINQSRGHCGPASLAMVLSWAGQPTTEEQISREVFTPGMRGSLQTDLIGASRRHGFMAIPISGVHSLIEEVQSGHPVIIFENLALSWAPNWHYAVVLGFDFSKPKPELIIHSGPNAFSRIDLFEFESAWKLGDYWGLVVLPPNQLSTSGSENNHLQSAIGLEKSQQIDAARTAYKKILNRWPQSVGSLIGLANLAFKSGDYQEAKTYLLTASQIQPNAPSIWHNLAISQNFLKETAKARQSAERALELAQGELHEQFRKSLRSILE